MIAIDTNILIRHLTEDDAAQLKKVHQLFRKHTNNNEIFISLIVLMESNWVLESCYNWKADKFCECVEDILRVPQFSIEQPQVVRSAIARAKKSDDFSDALIGQLGSIRGCKTYTFDKALKNDPAFIILE